MNTERLLKKFKTTSAEYPECHLSLSYMKEAAGGRGFYLSMKPMRVENEGVFVSRVIDISGSLRIKAKEIKRFSQKAFDNFISDERTVNHLISSFLSRGAYTLVDPKF